MVSTTSRILEMANRIIARKTGVKERSGMMRADTVHKIRRDAYDATPTSQLTQRPESASAIAR
jgi:hypothetical protein